jgi:hypothetical protein
LCAVQWVKSLRHMENFRRMHKDGHIKGSVPINLQESDGNQPLGQRWY